MMSSIGKKRHFRKCSIDGCVKPKYSNGFCQMHNWRVKHYGDPLRVRPERPLCSVDGCSRVIKARGLCQLHFGRQKRGLPFDYTRPTIAPQRYRLLRHPEHPLADARGRVYEHRIVLFAQIGWMRVPCFWCGCGISFAEKLVPDHLNHDRQDNRPVNLVPSCNSCNAGRTRRNPRVRTSVYSNFTFEFASNDTTEKVGT